MTTRSVKPTTRETSAYVRELGMRPLIITVVGSVIELRPKGLRGREVGDVASIWRQLVRERVAHERFAKQKGRRPR